MNNLTVKITSKTKNGQEAWEGVVNVAGLMPTKLVRKSDNTTYFGTRAAVLSAAKSVAKKFGYSGVEIAVAKRPTTKKTKKTKMTKMTTTVPTV